MFVVNLERHSERRESVKNKLNEFGLRFNLHSAIDGKNLTSAELHSGVAIGASLSKAEVGCAKSHQNIWQKIVDQKLPSAIVLEDDAVPNCSLEELFYTIKCAPKDWDVIYLDHFIPSKQKGICAVKANYSTQLDHAFLSPLEKVCGTWAYVLTYRAAIKLIENSNYLNKPIDHYTGDYTSINGYVVSPSLFVNDLSMGSSIQQANVKRKLRSRFIGYNFFSWVNRLRKCTIKRLIYMIFGYKI